MSSSPKIDFETFYKNLKRKFARIDSLLVWSEWDWSNEGCTHSVVMSELARERIRLAKEGNYDEVKQLLYDIEKAFDEAHHHVIAFIGTDFTVTILECENKTVREV
jgi:hypothetical protein